MRRTIACGPLPRRLFQIRETCLLRRFDLFASRLGPRARRCCSVALSPDLAPLSEVGGDEPALDVALRCSGCAEPRRDPEYFEPRTSQGFEFSIAKVPR